MNILTLLILIPTVTVLLLIFTKTREQARVLSAVGMGIQFLASLILLWMFFKERGAGNDSEFLFEYDTMWFKSLNIHFHVGIDGIGVLMILLNSIITFAGVFASWEMKDLAKEFFIFLILLSLGVFGFFISQDLFTMFVFYEIAVIPMYVLIGIWGTGPKEYSAMKLTLMLMGGSALLQVGLLGVYYYSTNATGMHTFDIHELAQMSFPFGIQKFFFPFIFVGFGVLGALFPFHTWSPDGHASAPTAVSMLHAGVLMKLGSYGAFRVAMYLMPEGAMYFADLFLVLTGFSVVYGAFVAIKKTDLKYINAYSSVSHVGLILFALMMFTKTAFTGAILQMISHGLMTAMFFGLIGMIYGRTHTREIYKMGGLMKILPIISATYVIAGLASLGLPGLSGFVAEMNIFVGAWENPNLLNRIFTIIAISAIVVTAVYILRVVGVLLLGPVKNEEFKKLHKVTWYERVVIILLMGSIAGIGLMPLWITDTIREGLVPMMEKFVH
ncbi:MAG TPA: NADH-quinone oxidoreductase subunit M [Bacteroidetes bacterium]|nr:NADH-quinone oxidoreductase subunit M [Bacteroidota bacterium]